MLYRSISKSYVVQINDLDVKDHIEGDESKMAVSVGGDSAASEYKLILKVLQTLQLGGSLMQFEHFNIALYCQSC